MRDINTAVENLIDEKLDEFDVEEKIKSYLDNEYNFATVISNAISDYDIMTKLDVLNEEVNILKGIVEGLQSKQNLFQRLFDKIKRII